MKDKIVGFIGSGNMASSLIMGLVANGYQADQIWASAPTELHLSSLRQNLGIRTSLDNKQVVNNSDVIILAVKPQMMAKVAREITGPLQDARPLVISVVSGVRIDAMQKWFGDYPHIVRCMPNTAALVRTGAIGLYAEPGVTGEEKNLAESILRTVGLTLWLDKEKELDTVTALSGSGPAYFFLLMEAMQAAADDMGLRSKDAKILTMQTALGAARMAMESDEDLASLRMQITSAGGTTEAALKVLEDGGFRQLIYDALTAAKARAEELAEMLGDEQSIE